MGKFQSYMALIFMSILAISFMSSSVFAEETTHNLSAIMKKEIDIGNDLKFDMFLRSSVSFVIPEKLKAGENATWEFVLNPVSIIFFLEIPSINKTFYSEDEVRLQEGNPIAIFDGVTLIFDLSPSVNLLVTGPATSNQTKLDWEDFSDKQSFETLVFLNASGKNEVTIDANFYLDSQISVYVQLQNYTSEIVDYPITPTLQMSPRISHSREVSPSTFTEQILNALGNSAYFLSGAFAIGFAVFLAFFIIKSKRNRKAKEKTLVQTPEPLEKPESTIYCIYCGEELPADAIYCRKCAKKIK